MSITTELQGIPPEQWASYKAERLAQLVAPFMPYTYTMDGVTIVVSGVSYERGMFRIDVASASTAIGSIRLNGPYYFQNPPVLVPDGNGGFTENVLEAAKQMLHRALTG